MFSRKKEAKRRDYLITKNINIVYKCTNENCDTRYVRMYQILHHLKKGISYGYGKEKYTLTHTKENYIIEDWCRAHNFGRIEFKEIQSRHMICPSCDSHSLVKEENYGWLDNIEEPRFITSNEWEMKRTELKNTLMELNKKLDDIEKLLKDYKEIKAFQSHYKLNTFSGSKDTSTFIEIREQLRLIVEFSPYKSIKTRAFFILEKLNGNPIS